MKNRQSKLIIGILSGLVLFASSVALLMYSKQNTLASQIAKNTEVYVARRDLQTGEYITANDIVKSSLPEELINFAPPKATQIVGKYVKEKLYKNEPIRPEKISSRKVSIKQQSQQTKVLKRQHSESNKHKSIQQTDTLSFPVESFRNLDNSIEAGDYIDIVSALPKYNKKGEIEDFVTKYIALHIEVLYYLRDKQKQKTLLTLSQTAQKEQTQGLKAKTLVLNMTPKNVTQLLRVYYKTQKLNEKRVYNTQNYGGQLWVIKTTKDKNATLQKMKERMLLGKKRYHRKQKQQKVSISYEN
jgi:Flp pilus assembly protein CpaB